MAITVKLDEALSESLAQPLLSRGYSVSTVRGQGWGGFKDSELWPRIVAESVFLITTDKGFGDLRAFPPGSHPGILVLRPDNESILEYRSLLEAVLSKYRLEALAGCVTVATRRAVRIRRKPLTEG